MPKRKLSSHKKTTKSSSVARKVKVSSRKAKEPRLSHGLASGWAGKSLGFNRNKSKTPLIVDAFGTKPDKVLTPRTIAVLSPIREKFGRKLWQRLDTDAGVLNAAIQKGVVEVVKGDPTSEHCQLRFSGNI